MTATNFTAECFFLDVGQGTSNVVLLGERRGIVIDCSPTPRVPLSMLKRYVDRIVALVVSHNDRDHCDGAAGIITAFPRAIDRVFLLQDRPVERIRLYAVIRAAMEKGTLPAPIRLERQEEPRELYTDPTRELSLELLFPTFVDNLDAQAAASPNATSAVLALHCGHRRIIFSGDSTLDDWRRIRSDLGAPIHADIFGIPHHGANVGGRGGDNEAAPGLRWLYTESVRCRYAVISVGTSNPYGHPAPATIEALRRSNAVVVCTQITRQCHDDLESLRPGVLSPSAHSRSTWRSDFTSRGNSRNLACAGTVVSEIGPDAVTVRRLALHQSGVDRLSASAGGHALCR